MEKKQDHRPVAVEISGVKKRYKLGQIGGGTLQADLQSWWARKRGKIDPNTKIGQEERLVGESFMALNGVDITVYKGEAVGIIGRNGAGKSTLLKLLSQVTAPTEGTIDLYGRVASMLEVGTGFNGEMTGRENIYMNGAILGMSRSEIEDKMENIIEFSEVRDFIDTPVKRYSSGMFVKLAFSVAAHLDSEIMIMDEVLAVGDMAFQKKCLDKMKEVAEKDGRTVLYVSHNMNTIRRLCNRVILLEQGKVKWDGGVEDGILKYMDSKEMGYTNVYDLTNVARHGYPSGQVKLCRVELLCKIPLVMRDKLIIALTWIKENLSETRVIFRFLIGNSTGLIGITMTDYIDIKNEDGITIELDTSILATGRYFVNIEIINKEGHKQTFLESVRAFQFEVLDNITELENFTWYKPWGNISFSQPRILNTVR